MSEEIQYTEPPNWEDLINNSCNILTRILYLNQSHEQLTLSGKGEFDPGHDRQIQRILEQWIAVSESIYVEIERDKTNPVPPEKLKELQNQIQFAAKILNQKFSSSSRKSSTLTPRKSKP